MKMLCLFVVSAGILSLTMIGCERHEFADTKGLHQEHGKHHGEPHEEGHDPRAKDEAHDKEAAAAEKKDAAPAPEKKTEEPRATGI